MIFLTGDVHHRSLNTPELPYMAPYSEADLAGEYLRIARRHGLKVTLFITGMTFAEERNGLKHILGHENLEIGGHGFSALGITAFDRIYRRFFDNHYYRRYATECREVEKTVEIISEKTQKKVISWRNHAYIYTKRTVQVLEKNGIKVWSDMAGENTGWPYYAGDKLINLPVNTCRDHAMLYHGPFSEGWIAKKNSLLNCNYRRAIGMLTGSSYDFRLKRYHADEFLDTLTGQVEARVAKGVAVMNLHPACMYVLDEFRTFDKICGFLSKYPSFFMSEAEGFIKTPGARVLKDAGPGAMPGHTAGGGTEVNGDCKGALKAGMNRPGAYGD